MRIDSHQHFWKFDPDQYSWIGEGMQLLARDWLYADLERELVRAELDGCVAVQARQSLEENRFLLNIAAQCERVRGVVGWVDLCAEDVEEQLALPAADPLFKGVRHVVQDEPDDDFVLRDDFMNGIARLAQFDLTYDLLTHPRQLPAAVRLVDEFPDQPFVLDHISKPPIRARQMRPWSDDLRELAQRPNVMCKVSGLVTEAEWGAWNADDFRPYLDLVFEAFGEDRLMFGSDWPVCRLSAHYSEVYALLSDYAAQGYEAARAKLFGLNAARFYRIAAYTAPR